MNRLRVLFLCVALAPTVRAEDGPPTTPTPHLSRLAEGDGPTVTDRTIARLDAARTPRQSNAVAFDRAQPGAFETMTLSAKVRVLEGGDGGAFLFLATAAHGTRGPAPFVWSWVEPNLRGTFAVALDVHHPPSQEMFTPWGNDEDRPQPEVSLHGDRREIVMRMAPEEFRGHFVDVAIEMRHVGGGAEVTVRIAGAPVYARFFVVGMAPYEARLALGAGTRADATTTFDVEDVASTTRTPAAPKRPPLHVEVFHHVRTDNTKAGHTAEVSLPPRTWAFGRVLLTLDLHDAGDAWDERDRNGEVSVWDDDGTKLGIVPFLTFYRTPRHWVVDVTHFGPLLARKCRFEVTAGTTFDKNRGDLMSVSLDFFPGAPDLEPYHVVPLWVGIAHHGSIDSHFRDFFAPRTIAIDADATTARVAITVTGHSQVGEFTPSRRTVVFAPTKGGETVAERRFEDVLWKMDGDLNPHRLQAGTWQYARAGWAPGGHGAPVVDRPHVSPPAGAGGRTPLRAGTVRRLERAREVHGVPGAGGEPDRARLPDPLPGAGRAPRRPDPARRRCRGALQRCEGRDEGGRLPRRRRRHPGDDPRRGARGGGARPGRRQNARRGDRPPGRGASRGRARTRHDGHPLVE